MSFRRPRRRFWHRLCRNERGSRHQPHAHHILGVPAYQAIGIALASDVLASAVSAYTYGKHKNLDIRNGLVMMAAVLLFTLVGSYISSLVPNHAMGNASVFLTMLLGIKFIVRPVLTTKDAQASKTVRQKLIQSIVSGIVVGFICGFIGAGGGMMMLLLLTSVLGYELKLPWEPAYSS